MFAVASRALIFASALLLPGQVLAEVEFVEKREIGAWHFLAVYDEDSGYGSCSASLHLPDYPSLQFDFDRVGGFDLVLLGSFQGWKFPAGKDYEVSYSIDDQLEVTTKAWGRTDASLLIDLGKDFSLTDALRQGNSISLNTPKGVFTFSLAGSGRVLDAMQNCARHWLRFRDAAAGPPIPSGSVYLTAAEKKELPEPIGTASADRMDYYTSPWVGAWTISASDGLEGDFSDCYMVPAGQSDPHLRVEVNRNLVWTIGLTRQSWKFPAGKSVKVALALDDGAFAPLPAKAIFDNALIVKLGKNPALLPQLKAAKAMRIRVKDEVFEFSLGELNLTTGAAAINAVQRCVTYYLTLEGALPAEAPTLEDLRSAQAPAASAEGPPGAGNANRAATPDVESGESPQYDFLDIGDWTVNAIRNADGFGLCVAGSFHETDIRVVFGVTDTSAWHMSLINEKWQLKENGHFQLRYAIDGGTPIEVAADVVGKMGVMMKLDGGAAAIEPFKRASRLQVFAAQQTFNFDLAGARAALDAAYDCMLRNSGQRKKVQDPFSAAPPSEAAARDPFSAAPGPEAAQDPFSPEAAPQPAAQAPTLSREAEATLVGTLILDRIGHRDAKALDPGSSDAIESYHRTWRLPQAKVGVLILSGIAPQRSAEFLRELEGRMRDACPAPTLAKRPDDVAPPILGRLRFACGPYAPAASFFVLPRPKGGTYVFLVMGDPDPEGGAATEVLDEQVAKALVAEPGLIGN